MLWIPAVRFRQVVSSHFQVSQCSVTSVSLFSVSRVCCAYTASSAKSGSWLVKIMFRVIKTLYVLKPLQLAPRRKLTRSMAWSSSESIVHSNPQQQKKNRPSPCVPLLALFYPDFVDLQGGGCWRTPQRAQELGVLRQRCDGDVIYGRSKRLRQSFGGKRACQSTEGGTRSVRVHREPKVWFFDCATFGIS